MNIKQLFNFKNKKHNDVLANTVVKNGKSTKKNEASELDEALKTLNDIDTKEIGQSHSLNVLLEQEQKIEEDNKKLFLNTGKNVSGKIKNVLNKNSLKDETILTIDEHTKTSRNVFSENLIDGNYKKIPVIGHLPINTQYQISGVLAILAIIGVIGGGFMYGNNTTKENNAIQVTTELSADIQKINSVFSDTVSGKANAYNNLVAVAQKSQLDLTNLRQQSQPSDEIINIQKTIENNLNQVNKNIQLLGYQSELLINNNEKVNDFAQHTTQLSNEVDNFIKAYSQQPLNQNELANVYSLKTNLQLLNGSLVTLLLSNKIETNIVQNILTGRQNVKNSLLALQSGDSSKAINPINSSLFSSYQVMAKDWLQLSTKIDNVINKTADLIQIKNLVPQNEQIVLNLNQEISNMLSLYKNTDMHGIQFAKMIIALSILIILLSAIMIFYIYSFEKDNRSLLEKIDNRKSEAAVLVLLREMLPLQNGDLTKKTTVTEEIAGQIADSINATIDSLAALVKKIKNTSVMMNQKTKEVNLISIEMLKTSETQTASLLNTGSQVISIASAITEIAKKTEKGSDEARQSAQVSQDGSAQIQDSLKSMQEINNNMNETVYLMKKVNASSKQISEIVELLSDLNEETSILALNATVQAAKAGEAGKGFKIVADSIQDLADKAGDAARRVGALISAVQTDVNAVENAIGKTTEEVTKGVKLSELAGNSLNKMTLFSQGLAENVAIISEDSKSYAELAKKLNENMRDILKTTEENKISTEKTVNAIAEISDISTELGESVQSFNVD